MKYMTNNEGFTILEVLVSMLILSLSLLLLLNMAMVAMEGNDWSNNSTASTQLMQEKLEQLRTDMVLVSGIDTVDNIERRWRVTTVANHLRKIEITAAWHDRRGQELSNSLTAYIRTNTI
ncbi:MAG: prepilin-type N-terminal cleavage/methylation domain-containing protein [Candidatus Zixiibacteriota bacterium]